MYTTSEEYKKQVLSNSREWDIYIDMTLADGTELHLTRDNIGIGTVMLKEGATCSDTIQIGSVFSNSFEFNIVNDKGTYTNYNFYNAKVEPYVGLYLPDSDKFEYIPLGVFWILENVKMLSVIPIVCFDSMSLTNRIFNFSSMVFPTTCSTILSEVSRQCSIEVDATLTSEVASIEWQIYSLLTNNPTCRDVLVGIGLLLNKNLRFNREGKLESFWYTNSGAFTNKDTRVGNSSYGDNPTAITGIQLKDAYGNVFSVGSKTYMIELPYSPIIQGSIMSTQVLSQALEAFASVSCRSSKVSYSGDPAIQAGDLVDHKDSTVGTITLPVMRLVFKLGGTGVLESLGSSESQQMQESESQKGYKQTHAQSEYLAQELRTSFEQTATDITSRVSATEKVASQAAQDVSGLTTEVATIVTKQTSINQTAEAVKIEVDKIVQEGTSKVKTSKGFTFDDSGLTISDTGNKLHNILNENGMTVRYGDTIMLSATSEGVEAVNLEASTYLIIGGRSRFENIRESNRVGCFWIGG